MLDINLAKRVGFASVSTGKSMHIGLAWLTPVEACLVWHGLDTVAHVALLLLATVACLIQMRAILRRPQVWAGLGLVCEFALVAVTWASVLRLACLGLEGFAAILAVVEQPALHGFLLGASTFFMIVEWIEGLRHCLTGCGLGRMLVFAATFLTFLEMRSMGLGLSFESLPIPTIADLGGAGVRGARHNTGDGPGPVRLRPGGRVLDLARGGSTEGRLRRQPGERKLADA